MQIISKIILLFVFVVIFVVLNKYGPGHVILFVGKNRIDLALSTLIIGLIILFVTLYYSFRFIATINSMPNKLKQARQRHLLLKSRKLLNLAAVNYFEGKFESSYKNAVESIKNETSKENKFVALMLAYKASSYMCDIKKEEEVYLQLDAYKDKKWQLANKVAIAENQYYKRLYGRCLDIINQILFIDKKHVLVRWIKFKTHLNLKNYDKAFEALMWLTQNDCLESQKAINYKIQVLDKLFEMVGDNAELQHFYRKLSIEDKKHPILNRYYLNALLRLNNYDIFLNTLENMKFGLLGPSELLVKLVKNLSETSKLDKLLRILNKLQTEVTNDYLLILATGICNYKLSNYLEARRCVEKSLEVKETLDGLLMLSFIANSIGDEVLRQITQAKLINATIMHQ